MSEVKVNMYEVLYILTYKILNQSIFIYNIQILIKFLLSHFLLDIENENLNYYEYDMNIFFIIFNNFNVILIN